MLLAITLALAACGPARAALYMHDFSGINAPIPDGDANGIADTRVLSGMTGSTTTAQINDVNVTLIISGGYNGDLYVHLVHSSGFTVLLNRVGSTADNSFGYEGTGLAITLDDAATTDVHLYETVSHPLNGGGQLIGSWEPDGRTADPDVVSDTSPRTTGLNNFDGLDPNGTWNLFLSDLVGGEESTLVSWGLEISTVPEPATLSLTIFAAAVGATQLIRSWVRRRKRQPGWQRS